MWPAEAGLLIGLVQILFLFGDDGGDVLAAGKRVFDLTLKILHGVEQPPSDRFVLHALRQILPLVTNQRGQD